MNLRDLFVIGCGSDDECGYVARRPRLVGAFTSVQSVIAFPLATSVVATVARASRTIGDAAFDSFAAPLVAAFAIGGALFVLTVSEPRARPRSLAGWIAVAVAAFVNSLLLFAAALGIEKF